MEMLLTGRFFSAEQAEKFGLVNEVVPLEDLSRRTRDLAVEMAQYSRQTLAFGKQTFYRQVDLSETSAYDYATHAIAMNCLDDDAQEGIRAFLEKKSACLEKLTEMSGKECYRFENWKRARAPFWPYFFLSLALASRRTKPAFFKVFLKSGFANISAFVMPCRIAPACAEKPPPETVVFTLNASRVLVKTRGCFTAARADKTVKYSSMG
jgi:hypothetical protein